MKLSPEKVLVNANLEELETMKLLCIKKIYLGIEGAQLMYAGVILPTYKITLNLKKA